MENTIKKFASIQECKDAIQSLLLQGNISDEQAEAIQLSCYDFINENTLTEREANYLDRGYNNNTDFIEGMLRVSDRLLLKQAQKEQRKANRREYLRNKGWNYKR